MVTILIKNMVKSIIATLPIFQVSRIDEKFANHQNQAAKLYHEKPILIHFRSLY
jgi:hypothetical protein